MLKELSIFIDKSGDFGEYDYHSPYYIITMIFHDQRENIQPAILKLGHELSYLNPDNLCIHTGPIIRKEEVYINMSVDERRRIFSQRPRRKQRGIKLETPQGAGYLTVAAVAKCLQAVTWLVARGNKMVAFIRQINIRYKCFCTEKKHISDVVESTDRLSNQISGFIREHYADFLAFDDVKIYHDNG